MIEIRYDRHAKRRMKWRNISVREVEEVLTHPEKTEATVMGRTNVYKAIGKRFIKVTFKDYGDHLLIISAVDKSD
jgi:hypothetical protein